MDNYPKHLIEQYLKASNKLKKFDRIVFKRFAPNVGEVLEDFAKLALKFEEAGIYQYAAMCYLGVAKCEMFNNNVVCECHAYLKSARTFLKAHESTALLQLRSNRNEFKEGALRCYSLSLERCADDSVLKAAIIREMMNLQPDYDGGTSSFASPAHRIYELELAAHASLQRCDFLPALKQLDDIVDNIYERKRQDLYLELLRRVEILRLLLLIVLELPPAQQSPSHVMLIEYYQQLGSFEPVAATTATVKGVDNHSATMGSNLPTHLKYVLAEIVIAWTEQKPKDMRVALQQLKQDVHSLNEAQCFVIDCICQKLDKN